MLIKFGWMHGAPYRGYGYVPLRFGENIVRRMGTQQQLLVKSWTPYRGNGYILLRCRCVCVLGGGGEGNVIRRMGTQHNNILIKFCNLKGDTV